LWSRSLGLGHSAIVGEGGRLYTMYRQGEQEVVIALDAKTGKTIWEHGYAAPYIKGMDMSYGDGPHATPLIAGSLLYTVGATGKLFCLEKATGQRAGSAQLLAACSICCDMDDNKWDSLFSRV
jgi:outer membrane protein assembly factor BamB